MPRLVMTLAALLLAATAAARAQTTSTQGDHTKVLLDNDRVHVTEVTLAPGAKIELPTSANQFAYLLTDAALVFSRPGHTPYELDFKAGEATLLPAQATHAENQTGKEVRAVLVVLKESGKSHPAKTGKRSGHHRSHKPTRHH